MKEDKEDAEEPQEVNEFKYVKQFDSLHMLIRQVTKGIDNDTKYPVNRTDIKALVFIGIFPNQSMSFYSNKLNMEQGSFNYVANKFVDLGLVKIIKNDSDKRKKLFVLTEVGEAETIRLKKGLNDHIKKRLDILSDEELEMFFSSIDFLRTIAERLKDDYERCNK